MFVEKLESLPEEWRGNFVECELDGKKGYQHKDTIALANSLRNAKAERDDLKSKLTQTEQQKTLEIEAARAAALEEAKSKGDVAAIEKRYQEQMADLEKRTAEKVRAEAQKEFNAKRLEDNRKAMIDKLSSKYAVDNDAADMLRLYLDTRVKADEENGKMIFLNDDGGASSLDESGFEKEFFSSQKVARLVKNAPFTTGGGLANGGIGGGATEKTSSVSRIATGLSKLK